MLMNDDLHNIDDLFRDGIEGHCEDVPPLVWEAVSHDLDKKQASYYKAKYNRLKQGAWLLLLLCFLGGGYIVYKSSGGSDKATAKKEPVSSLPVIVRNSSNDKNGKPPSVVSRSNNVEEDGPDHSNETVSNGTEKSIAPPKEKSTGTDTASGPLSANTTIAQTKTQRNRIDEAPNVAAKQLSVRKASQCFSSSFIHQRIQRTQNNNEDIESAKTKKQRQAVASLIKTDLTLSPVPQPAYNAVALSTKDYKAPIFDIKAALSSNLSILPQTTSSKSKASLAHGFSLTAFVAPNVSFDRLEDNDHLAGPGRNRQEARKQEQDNFSFSAGLLLSYQLTSKWELQSGIGITSSSTAIAPETVYAKADNSGHTRYELHCSSGYAYINPRTGIQVNVGDSAKTSGTVSKLTYVTLPVAINYRINKGRFSLVPNVGAGINFLTSGKTKTDLSNPAGSENTTTAISGLKPAYVDAQLGLGIEYNFTKKISISLRPNAKLALTSINRETPVQSYQNRLSLESGVRIKF